ncbi:MAG TPA: hypothetical protein VLA19_13065 [Herpetosiphonaceae bacterium]|nr:hypothetical protein [Herpetosiphonaceae bacterium]
MAESVRTYIPPLSDEQALVLIGGLMNAISALGNAYLLELGPERSDELVQLKGELIKRALNGDLYGWDRLPVEPAVARLTADIIQDFVPTPTNEPKIQEA